MNLSFRFGTRALGIGVFYHAQKRILYLHPLPLVAVLVRLCRHKWDYPERVGVSAFQERCVHCGERRDVAPSTSAKVPLMITKAMRRQLTDLGYTKGQIDALTPAEANARIADGRGPNG